MEEKNYIELFDENDNAIKVELLFSIVRNETGVRYLFVIDPENDDQVVPLQANEDGSIQGIGEKPEQDVLDFLNETFEAYQNGELAPVGEEEEEEEEEECSCGCGHHHHHHHHHEGECCSGGECDCDCKEGECDCKEGECDCEEGCSCSCCK